MHPFFSKIENAPFLSENEFYIEGATAEHIVEQNSRHRYSVAPVEWGQISCPLSLTNLLPLFRPKTQLNSCTSSVKQQTRRNRFLQIMNLTWPIRVQYATLRRQRRRQTRGLYYYDNCLTFLISTNRPTHQWICFSFAGVHPYRVVGCWNSALNDATFVGTRCFFFKWKCTGGLRKTSTRVLWQVRWRGKSVTNCG